MKPRLEYASRGPFVSEAQTKLNALMPEAQPPLKLDGTYGEKTIARVKQFQKSRGLVPDGVVGKRTWEALDGGGPPVDSAASTTQAQGTHPKNTFHLQGVKVYNGAPLQCSWGTAISQFRLNSTNAATENDYKALMNIWPFGYCKAPHRVVGYEHYEDSKLGVMFDTGTPILPSCIPVIVTPWMGAFEKSGHAGTRYIDKTASCLCAWTGRISFK